MTAGLADPVALHRISTPPRMPKSPPMRVVEEREVQFLSRYAPPAAPGSHMASHSKYHAKIPATVRPGQPEHSGCPPCSTLPSGRICYPAHE